MTRIVFFIEIESPAATPPGTNAGQHDGVLNQNCMKYLLGIPPQGNLRLNFTHTEMCLATNSRQRFRRAYFFLGGFSCRLV